MTSARDLEKERQRKHFELLARPNPRKVTKKFDPTTRDKVPTLKQHKSTDSAPSKRIEILAQPIRVTPKYMPTSEEPSTFLDRAILEATCTARLDHLSKPTVRHLEAMRREYQQQHKKKSLIDKINEKIAISFDTIYYHNAKSLAEKKKQREKDRQTKTKPTGWNACGDRQRLEIISKPKPPRKPSPRRRRKWKPLEQLKARVEKLAIPNNVYIRPSQDSFLLQQKARLAGAQTYTISDRVRELTKAPKWRLKKPWVPTGVSRGALEYQISSRMEELAQPHHRHKAVDGDVKENAYDVSPNALKYKPTPRMIELAKHVER